MMAFTCPLSQHRFLATKSFCSYRGCWNISDLVAHLWSLEDPTCDVPKTTVARKYL